MIGNFHGTADVIPVDIATNMMIAVAWNTAIDRYYVWMIDKFYRTVDENINKWFIDIHKSDNLLISIYWLINSIYSNIHKYILGLLHVMCQLDAFPSDQNQNKVLVHLIRTKIGYVSL